MKRLIVTLVLIAAIVSAAVASGFFLLNKPVFHEGATFIIQRGTPLIMISEQLKRAGVIKHPILFSIYARIMKVDRKIRAGEYEFAGGLSEIAALDKLKLGDCKKYKITLIEGWTIDQIADYLASQPFATASFGEAFRTAASDKYLLRSLGVEADSAEGYLFPNTYLIERPYTAEWLVKVLVEEFKHNWGADLDGRAVELGMTPYQVITLASVIEKETGSNEERPFISSVFHNRLKKGMPLQADPTVIYGLKDFDGNLRKADLSISHPYNTYVHTGLPKGPISNPGIASIRAALWPAKTDYLYFVSRNNGTHEFTKTLAEHSRAVTEYQKGTSKNIRSW